MMDEQRLVYMAGPLFDEGERWWIENDKRVLDECTLIVANPNGLTTDDGAAWELGYGYAKGKYAIGFFSDWRQRFPDGEKVNLMIENSLDLLVDSFETLQHAREQWKIANP
jgi:nucleoside 2-deoxyribosyltransferase